MNPLYLGRALHIRWPWYAWDEDDRPWKGMVLQCDTKEMQLFAACTKISLGNGKEANFWNDRWLDGLAPAVIAPLLVRMAWGK
jgi:hypothetical protein